LRATLLGVAVCVIIAILAVSILPHG
jgi:hypothetical protein